MPSVTGTIQVVSVRGGGAVDGLRPVYTLLLLFDCLSFPGMPGCNWWVDRLYHKNYISI